MLGSGLTVNSGGGGGGLRLESTDVWFWFLNRCTFNCDGLPSRFAFSPDGSSKLHPLREAPSALVQSIFTPCKLAPCKRSKVLIRILVGSYWVTTYKKFMWSYQIEEKNQSACYVCHWQTCLRTEWSFLPHNWGGSRCEVAKKPNVHCSPAGISSSNNSK